MGAPRAAGRFRNEIPIEHAEPRRVLKWLATRKPAPWTDVDAKPGPPPPGRIDAGGLRATLVNHSTVLVQTEGVNVLTDPIWSERCSPVSLFGPRRHRPPGLRFEDLPPIQLVLLSHNHYDHFDLPTLRRLAKSHAPAVITGLGNRRLVESAGFGDVHELDWWESLPVPTHPALTVTATPAHHFSGRTPFDRDRTLWCGLALHGSSGSVFFAGDTGYGDHFARIRERLGSPRLALLPIGAYEPDWFMRRVHMNPADAVQAHIALGAAASMAIHFGTFRLADEGMDDPPAGLARARAAARLPERAFVAPRHGVGIDVPPESQSPQNATGAPRIG